MNTKNIYESSDMSTSHETEAASQWRETRSKNANNLIVINFVKINLSRIMRRSAAPSVRAAKKMKFCTPFLASSNANTSGNSNSSLNTVQVDDPDLVRALLFLLWFSFILGLILFSFD